MGHKHNRDDILAGALDAVTEEGLSKLTFGRLAKRLGVNDRIIVYYFPTKADLITEVLVALGADIQRQLESAFVDKAADHVALLRQAWPVLAQPQSDGLFGLMFEAIGLAAAGQQPYAGLVDQLFEGWVGWLELFFEGSKAQRRIEAETALVLMDGLLLVRQMAGPKAANRAAGRLGIR